MAIERRAKRKQGRGIKYGKGNAKIAFHDELELLLGSTSIFLLEATQGMRYLGGV